MLIDEAHKPTDRGEAIPPAFYDFKTMRSFSL